MQLVWPTFNRDASIRAVLATQSGLTADRIRGKGPLLSIDGTMSFTSSLHRVLAVLCIAAFTVVSPVAFAQSGNGKPPEAPKASPEAAKDGQKKIDEIAEAARVLNGPAGNPECIWLGRRAVSLLWRDDLDTAFRHLDLYDRFGCPSAHVQATFRCLVKQGNIDPKAQATLNSRVHDCWLNPELPPSPAAAAQPDSGGTTPR